MTWRELKRYLEIGAGLRESDVIVEIDLGPWKLNAVKTTAQDPDAINVHFTTQVDGSREVEIS
jgi:hypothetical protein